jgi:ABC-type bacteriocin/lantibiotic exporter with double-glycine peptidase domain
MTQETIPNTEDKKITCEHFTPVPLCLQETPYTCGVACVQSILACYGIVYRQDALADILKSKPYYGTDVQSIIQFMNMLNFQASYVINMNIDNIKDYIDHCVTTILMIQSWKEDDIDYSAIWRDSHYVIACGYEEDRIIFMDPITLGNYTYIHNDELMKRWHTLNQENLHNYYSGIIITNEKLPFVYKPYVIKHQD